ncbi:MAG: YobA family protein [Mollicutes bacterium]|nr:YobA family protein [Mollicutes bacterium]MDY3210209.1 hypothetical protein [Candidatus Enterosoma sp.]MCI7788321.1 YobA family protein [Mollicutes bacterium]MDD7036325.1 hypothetical protein [Mollicutes bacterium]MDD7612676.1 hypothetical protein [Mollicutes bacterium]
MKNFLFASLSLVNGFSKYKDNPEGNYKGREVEQNNTFIISGTYEKVNDIRGLNVSNTGTEDYFYVFDVQKDTKVTYNGKDSSFDSIKEGDTLKVSYDGTVSLVYPPKLNNVTKVEIVGKEKDNGDKA